jgi:hypothetical protein
MHCVVFTPVTAEARAQWTPRCTACVLQLAHAERAASCSFPPIRWAQLSTHVMQLSVWIDILVRCVLNVIGPLGNLRSFALSFALALGGCLCLRVGPHEHKMNTRMQTCVSKLTLTAHKPHLRNAHAGRATVWPPALSACSASQCTRWYFALAVSTLRAR